MAQNQGTLVGAAIRPADSADKFASAFQNEIKGGHHAVDTAAERDAIPVERREFGMLCWVSEDGKDYRLCNLENGGVDNDLSNNANWIEQAAGGGTFDFTTQTIDSGGNYNDLEVTADLLVFTNENAQAVINGVWGRKEFHILNLSETYEVRINHESGLVTGDGVPIKLPTSNGSVGIKGTARVLFTEDYGYFVADTWGSTYRPEFTGITEDEVVVVDSFSNAKTVKKIEIKRYEPSRIVDFTLAELNASPYLEMPIGTEIICESLGSAGFSRTFEKISGNAWEFIDKELVT